MPPVAQKDSAFLEKYGPWVLVSGGSEGTGAEFSLACAAKGANVIIVARRPDKIEELAVKIRQTYGVLVETLSLDLSIPEAAARLQAATEGKELGLVIFNAGGDSVGGRFLDHTYEEWRLLLRRNIDMLTEALHRFASYFVARGKGGIILVGSEAALGGIGRIALYTATKGYALNLGESLWRELKPRGVDVLNVLIGATDTPKLRTIFARNNLPSDAVALTEAGDVARVGLASLGEGPTIVLNALEEDANPLMSRRLRRERTIRESEFLNNFYGPE